MYLLPSILLFHNDQRVLLKITLNIHLLLPSPALASLTEGLGSWFQSPFQLFSVSCPLSCSVLSNSLWPHGLYPARLLCPWDSPGKNTGVGGCALLQGTFPTRWSKPRPLHCRRILYCWATGETWGLRWFWVNVEDPNHTPVLPEGSHLAVCKSIILPQLTTPLGILWIRSPTEFPWLWNTKLRLSSLNKPSNPFRKQGGWSASLVQAVELETLTHVRRLRPLES